MIIVGDDTRGVTVNQTATLPIEEGGTAAYTVVLDSEPTRDVTVTPQVQEAANADLRSRNLGYPTDGDRNGRRR